MSRPDDLLYVEDIQTVEQICGVVSVQFDDHAVARFFDAQVDAGRRPEQFARIWLHTHPEISAQPSGTDEETFARVFGQTDWAVMFILSKTDEVYCRLRFNVGPGGELGIPVSVDYHSEFAGSDFAAWEAEYRANIRVMVDRPKKPLAKGLLLEPAEEWLTDAAASKPDVPSDSMLRDHLQRCFGWSAEEIDCQLESGWTLEELVKFCRYELEFCIDALPDQRTDALFGA